MSLKVSVVASVSLFYVLSVSLGQLPTLPPINWENVTVESDELGKIIGLKAWSSQTQKLFYTFHGIPYAHPTGGEGRFKPSVLKEDIINEPHFLAWNPLIACPQGGFFRSGKLDLNNVTLPNVLKAVGNLDKEWYNEKRQTENIVETEEVPVYSEEENACLVLNINTPLKSRGENRKYPVIFYVHGGGSTNLWGSTHMGFRLMERDVILVTINYRLGVLGALNLGTDDAPGNAAMYDCITALKWVQKYIHLFNGDKDNVIAYGESAGGMMVSHLLLSPLAAGLIHGVIGASGSALAPWGTADHPSIHHHLKVCENAGCYHPETPESTAEIIECMRGLHPNVIVEALKTFTSGEHKAGRLGFDAIVPSIQWGDLTVPLFMPQSPYQVLQEGKQNNVPLIMGANRHDGSFALEILYHRYLVGNNLVNNTEFMKNELMSAILNGALKMPDPSGVMHDAIAQQYFGDSLKEGKFWDMLPGLIDLTTVFGFKAGAYKMVEMHAKLNPNSYYYAFDYRGFWTTYDLVGLATIPCGVSHIDDLLYVFSLFPLFTENDLAVSKRMIDWIINFAYFQDPNGQSGEIRFPPYDPIDHTYLKIDKEDSIEKHCRDSWIGTAKEIVDLEHPFQ